MPARSLGADLVQKGNDGAGLRLILGFEHALPGVGGDDRRAKLAHELTGLIKEPVADSRNGDQQHQKRENGE